MTSNTPSSETIAFNSHRSPLSWDSIGHLFLKPTRFFRTFDLQSGSVWIAAAWIVGIGAAIDRIDWNLASADLGRRESSTLQLAEDWLRYWPVVLIAGVVMAGLRWWVGGWWYRKRLIWSSTSEPDADLARLVYTYSALVCAIPTIGYALYCTATFPDYLSAWQAESLTLWLLQLVSVSTVFWSYIVSYKGIRARFEVQTWKARLWFVVLPGLYTVLILGFLSFAFATLGSHE